MSTTVAVPGGFEITSNSESAESMLASLTPPKPDTKPRVLVDKGQPVEAEEQEGKAEPERKATPQEAGKKGGEATAAIRRKEAREAEKAEPVKDAKPAKEAAPKEGTDVPEKGAEEQEEKPLGKPRDDPRARIQELATKKREAEERAERAERALATARRPQPVREERQPEPERDDRPEPPPAPKLSDFTSKHENYDDAVTAFVAASAEHNRKLWESEQQIKAQRTQ